MKDFDRFVDREVYIRSKPYFLMGSVFLRKIEMVFIEQKTLTHHNQFSIAMRYGGYVPDTLLHTLPKLDIEYCWKNSFSQVPNRHQLNKIDKSISDRSINGGKKISLFLHQITFAKHDRNRSELLVNARHASKTAGVIAQSLTTGGTSAH